MLNSIMRICIRCNENVDKNSTHLNGLNICDDILYTLKRKGLVMDGDKL